MSPIALPEGYTNQSTGNGSFITPQATGAPVFHSNGCANVNDADVHPTARRSPAGGLFRVEDNTGGTRYLDGEGEIRSIFVDRGASVISELNVMGLEGRG